MKRLQSILCASLLTLAISSTVFAGSITTLKTNDAGSITTLGTGSITTLGTGSITTLGTGSITTLGTGSITTLSARNRSGLRDGNFSPDLTDYFFMFWATLGL